MKNPSLQKPTQPPWISVSSGKLIWQIHPDFNRPALLERLADPEKLLTQDAESVRKDPRPRNNIVVRISLPCHDQPLIVKRYRSLNFWRSVKDGLRKPRAFCAFQKAIFLLEQNISTALPIAASSTHWREGRSGSSLIMEQVPDARPLREFRKGNFSLRENRIVIRQLAGVIGRLHNVGLSHSDPTLSNFFVQNDPQQIFRIVLIDLDGLRASKRISKQKVAADLTPLFRRVPMSPRERLWFVTHYCRARNDVITPRELLPLLAEKSLENLARRSNGFFSPRKIRWETGTNVLPQKVVDVMKQPESFLQNRELYLKHSRVVTITRVPATLPGEPSLVLRRLNYGKDHHQFRDLFRPSRARRALRHGLMLEKSGVATPRAFAAADVTRFFWPRAAYLITSEIPGAKTLARYLAQVPLPSRALVNQLAELLARLHNENFSHRDLKATNILLDENAKPFLIDLDGLRKFGRLSLSRVITDLVRFAQGVSRHQEKLRFAQWRFLIRYCQQRKPQIPVRDLAAQLAVKLRE